MNERYLLTNVRLEQGFIRRQGVVQGTECAEFTLDIIDGRIHALYAGTQHLPDVAAQDGRGYLMLPVTRDEHIHLDKTFYGGPWRAARENGAQDIFEMIALEQEILPELLPTSVQRTHALLQLLQQQGTTYVRSHCNIEPVSGLQSLRHLLEALAPWREQLQCEIVAFPQHGLLRSGSLSLMRKALAMGCEWVGGLDPSKVDGDMVRSLEATLELAVEAGKGIDYHLHEDKSTGIACIRYLLDAMEQEPVLRGKLTLSHAYCLAQIDREELSELAGRMAALGVSLATCLPIGKDVMPLPFLRERGVRLLSGTDSVIDHWSPFGSASMLEKAYDWARLYTRGTEFELSRALAIATGNCLPLADSGERVWPKLNDEASFILLNAACSAQVVARLPAVEAVYFRGKRVWIRE
ncbi:TPA: amidohydrolase [Klebsiella michiganensis]|uniref:amidohydrolase n=1 Tax=Klebsiella TaxID=570 RepID=UPI00141CCE63|nr:MULTISPECIES: amidohydrolase [Klebsiella]ELS4546638.1 amidohydrolase family protein [Klebsiella michiganensis]MBS6905779.1 amidohydrolase family protein [Klebsiella sp.]MEE1968721.1 amidohydrolase [Klebsiella michiganensis]QLO25143.1 amidohydrolase family protein [Klebsiella michiganensis]CAB1220422.1 N-isopropylammelide isopropyl amidohydrolase [Klebsiella michiganensis]